MTTGAFDWAMWMQRSDRVDTTQVIPNVLRAQYSIELELNTGDGDGWLGPTQAGDIIYKPLWPIK